MYRLLRPLIFRLDAERAHQLDVFRGAVVVVAGDGGGVAVLDTAGFLGEGVPAVQLGFHRGYEVRASGQSLNGKGTSSLAKLTNSAICAR